MPFKKILCPVCEVNRIDPRNISCRKCFVGTGRATEIQRNREHEPNSGQFIRGQSPWNKGMLMCSPQWSGGETKDSRGYILKIIRYKPDGTAIYKSKHTWIMEEYLKCKIEYPLLVHHKDENPSNNSLDNLEVMTHKEHVEHHKGWERRKWRPIKNKR